MFIIIIEIEIKIDELYNNNRDYEELKMIMLKIMTIFMIMTIIKISEINLFLLLIVSN